MCTPSTVEMYRVVKIDDPETFPGTFGGDNPDSIQVVEEAPPPDPKDDPDPPYV